MSLPANPITSFSKAKKIARDKIYFDHHQTFYCGCNYISKGYSGGEIDASNCNYQIKSNVVRGNRLEWEHIVPASIFGDSRECWTTRIKECASLKGRACCIKIDLEFKRIEADLHNLVPAIGELNGDRLNYAFSIIEGEPREYGACDFEIDITAKQVEVAESIRGDIARIWLYMNVTYNIIIPADHYEMLKIWHQEDPVDAWEIIRDHRIYEQQGNSNPFVSLYDQVEENLYP